MCENEDKQGKQSRLFRVVYLIVVDSARYPRWGNEIEDSTTSSAPGDDQKSLQKLLRDFATDSDELTKSDSASMLQPATEESVLSLKNVPPTDGDESTGAGAPAPSELATVPTFIADTLPLKTDVTQVPV